MKMSGKDSKRSEKKEKRKQCPIKQTVREYS